MKPVNLDNQVDSIELPKEYAGALIAWLEANGVERRLQYVTGDQTADKATISTHCVIDRITHAFAREAIKQVLPVERRSEVIFNIRTSVAVPYAHTF